jgi:DNA-binding MarR family transcriptional regulator
MDQNAQQDAAPPDAGDPDRPADSAESAVRAARELRAVFGRLRRRLRQVADLGGLTPSQTSVLSLLSKGGPTSASELAATEGVRPQSMAATLAALAEHGLIDRHPDPEDGRRQLVTLSETGREHVAGSRQARDEWLARALLERYTEDERRALIEALALLERLAHP